MKAYLSSYEEVLAEVNSGEKGLTPPEAALRLKQNGPNKLNDPPKKTLIKRIIEQIKDPMVIVLIAAAIISGISKEIADTAIILIVVVLNTILGIVQESKAEKAIEALQSMSMPHSQVRRGGEVMQISTSDIVLGDIVILEAGNSVPADMRILQSASLKIEEAALTGESVPTEKTAQAIASQNGDIPLGDRHNMAYMGTNVVYGRGEGVVTAVGMDTEMGKIAGILSNTAEEKTPLQEKLASLSKILSAAVIGICLFIFIFNVLQSGGFSSGHVLEWLLTAVSLAVAAIPEGLVVVVTVLLSIGVTKMSKRGAIIRRLTAVETLGSTEVICSDKTGTLTQNRMTVIKHQGDETLLREIMWHCNDAQLGSDGEYMGDPTEIALKEFGKPEGASRTYPRVNEAPFDSVRKLMTTVHEKDGAFSQYTKGAPDELLNCCTSALSDGSVVPLTDALRAQILKENKEMADQALRVLGGAVKTVDTPITSSDPQALENGLTFVGLCGMIDPIRPEVKAAVRECKNAGVRAVMITGDHKDTAVAIARELGLLDGGKIAVTGAELEQMDEQEFEQKIGDIAVYARVQPEHKVRIVTMWKKKGKITAMTGDGVNDAPAIKSADIGIGMGITGTDVTKNVADMVLSDDNFATIVIAVEEGRRIYENIKKAIQFLLASNLSEVVSIFIASLMGLKLFAPIHILWINLITDTFPAMALGMEEAEADSMQRPPRPGSESIFAGGLGIDVIWQGVLIAGLTLASFFIGRGISHLTGMTMAFLTLNLCEIFHSLNMRSRTFSLFQMKGHNRYLIGAMLLSFVLTLAVIYIPGLNTAFSLAPLSLPCFIQALGLAFCIVPVIEVVKLVRRKISDHA